MNYESNSNKSKEKKKNIKQVATGTVKTKSFLEKVASNFIQSDANNIKDYIITDVLIPATKKAIDDVVSNGIKMLLYGKGAKKIIVTENLILCTISAILEKNQKSQKR